MLGTLAALEVAGDKGAVLRGALRDVRVARGAADRGVERLVLEADGGVAAAGVDSLEGAEVAVRVALVPLVAAGLVERLEPA